MKKRNLQYGKTINISIFNYVISKQILISKKLHDILHDIHKENVKSTLANFYFNWIFIFITFILHTKLYANIKLA